MRNYCLFFRKKLLFFTILLLPALFSSAALPEVEILGNKYYVYEVKKGDTFFGISREFNWDDNLLVKLNPYAVSPLKKGIKLFYPVAEKTEDNLSANLKNSKDPFVYRIEKGDNFNSIAKDYGITVAALFKTNPGLTPRGIIPGDSILIPK